MDYDNPQFIAAVKNILRNLTQETNQINAAAQNTSTPQVKEESPTPVVHELHVSDATVDRVKAKSSHEQRHENFKDWVETATIGIVLLYTIFAGFNWYELNTQNINQSAAIIGAGATADRALNYTRQQITNAEDGTRLDERAWVGVMNPITDGNSFDVKDKTVSFKSLSITIRNSGKTPAIKANWTCCIITNRKWEEPIPDYDALIASAAKSVKRANRQVLGALKRLPPNVLARGEIENMHKKLGSLFTYQGGVYAPMMEQLTTLIPSAGGFTWPLVQYVQGEITYNDIFNKQRHTTKFCLQNIGSGFSFCPEGNWMD